MGDVIRAIWRGCGYVPGYGHHPGTGLILMCNAGAAFVGVIEGGIAGVLIGLLFMAPMTGVYLWGAHERGRKEPTHD
ncbi:hypothetical protein [Oceanicaulis sp.]|uniref:hypothetical protein n=1 Tax=Oceanicaulis sp. TaxID=1924941 RepID=UPI003D2801E7